MDMVSELEFNLDTMPRINCAAAGNPFPVRGSMELRKPDGTVLLVSPMTPGSLAVQGLCPLSRIRMQYPILPHIKSEPSKGYRVNKGQI